MPLTNFCSGDDSVDVDDDDDVSSFIPRTLDGSSVCSMPESFAAAVDDMEASYDQDHRPPTTPAGWSSSSLQREEEESYDIHGDETATATTQSETLVANSSWSSPTLDRGVSVYSVGDTDATAVTAATTLTRTINTTHVHPKNDTTKKDATTTTPYLDRMALSSTSSSSLKLDGGVSVTTDSTPSTSKATLSESVGIRSDVAIAPVPPSLRRRRKREETEEEKREIDSLDTDEKPGAYFVHSSDIRSEDSFDNLVEEDEDDRNTTLERTEEGYGTAQNMVLSRPLDASLVQDDEDFEEQLRQRMEARTVDALTVVREGNRNTAASADLAAGGGHDDNGEAAPKVDDNDTNQKCRVSMSILGCIVTVCTLIVLLVVFVPNQSGPEDLRTAVPTAAPQQETEDDETDMEKLFKLLGPISGEDVLWDETTPQHQAMVWLDSTNLTQYWNVHSTDNTFEPLHMVSLVERYVVAVLYYSTNGPGWMEDMNFLSDNSICEWKGTENGIKCNEEGDVVEIRLSK